MHDFSRDLMLAGTQQSVELKLALDQEQQKSKKLEESMRKLDEEMRRTDELLYQMIPKQVADRLRRGENPIDTCEVRLMQNPLVVFDYISNSLHFQQMFDSVSILFSDVVTFTEICSRITPMEVVSMLNGMYSIFDTLTERNNVYKVKSNFKVLFCPWRKKTTGNYYFLVVIRFFCAIQRWRPLEMHIWLCLVHLKKISITLRKCVIWH